MQQEPGETLRFHLSCISFVRGENGIYAKALCPSYLQLWHSSSGLWGLHLSRHSYVRATRQDATSCFEAIHILDLNSSSRGKACSVPGKWHACACPCWAVLCAQGLSVGTFFFFCSPLLHRRWWQSCNISQNFLNAHLPEYFIHAEVYHKTSLKLQVQFLLVFIF